VQWHLRDLAARFNGVIRALAMRRSFGAMCTGPGNATELETTVPWAGSGRSPTYGNSPISVVKCPTSRSWGTAFSGSPGAKPIPRGPWPPRSCRSAGMQRARGGCWCRKRGRTWLAMPAGNMGLCVGGWGWLGSEVAVAAQAPLGGACEGPHGR
jgi:hypothetical protein